MILKWEDGYSLFYESVLTVDNVLDAWLTGKI